jgi:hypothetical protein
MVVFLGAYQIHALVPHKSYPSYHRFCLQLVRAHSEYHTNDILCMNKPVPKLW